MNIDLFKREHKHILVDVAKLRCLVESGVSENAQLIVEQLASAHILIRRHLLAEEQILYPALARAPDPATAQMSRQFKNLMGGLLADYAAFAARWNVADRVVADPEAFRDEAIAVCDALHRRVQWENRELYPLAEAI